MAQREGAGSDQENKSNGQERTHAAGPRGRTGRSAGYRDVCWRWRRSAPL
jgi:hypothetical protein